MDSNKKYPVLYDCGHTTCIECFIQTKTKCPFDNTIHNSKKEKKNFYLIEIIEKFENEKLILENKLIKSKQNLIEAKIISEQEYVLSFSCPYKDKLKVYCQSAQTCAVCMRNVNNSFGCAEHDFHVCIKGCCIDFYNEYKDKKEKALCVYNHNLKWIGDEIRACFICEKAFTDGFSCFDGCHNFNLCINCSNFKFSLNHCPNKHELKWNCEKEICSRCNLHSSGFKCYECFYFLCGKCKNPIYDYNKIDVIERISDSSYLLKEPEKRPLTKKELFMNVLELAFAHLRISKKLLLGFYQKYKTEILIFSGSFITSFIYFCLFLSKTKNNYYLQWYFALAGNNNMIRWNWNKNFRR